jgi:phytoene dehydrogenase-like protein
VTSTRYDAIVVGGGQNGLAAAVRLAGRGRKVVVLERSAALGGLCAAHEIHPGHRVPGVLHDDGLLSAAVAKRLGLAEHGLKFRDAPPTFLAEEGGRGLLLHRRANDADAELRARSAHDADSYARYRAFLAKLAPLVEALTGSPPPPLSPSSLGDLFEIAGKGLGLWKLGRKTTLELMRVAPMCVADYLNELFETPLLVEALAAPAVAGTWSGPWSAGTNTNLLLAEANHGQRIAGGPAALVAALESAARATGAVLWPGAEVERIRIEAGRVAGVELAGGEAIDATTVISTCDPKRTMLSLLAPGSLPIRIEDEFRRIRMRGTLAKVHLALAAPLELAARPGERFETIRIGGGHVDDLERAFDAIKYRGFSDRPFLDVRVPSLADPSLAPAGGATVSIAASYAPLDLDGGWSDERREDLFESVLAVLERHAPNVRATIVASETLTPTDLEARFALSGGQLHHGEAALDQMLVLRPAPSAARYASPVPGLFLGGSGSHPGGGVRCTAGLLAADAALG